MNTEEASRLSLSSSLIKCIWHQMLQAAV